MQSFDLDNLVACSQCDTLHQAAQLGLGEHAHCQKCGATLMTSRPRALIRILSLALTGFILMIVAITFPFLDLSAQGFQSHASVIDAILAFDEGIALPLAVATAFFIILLPLSRLIALIVAIGPLAIGAKPRPVAKAAFGVAEALRPWAMAEIFMVGVTVALIKVAGLATITLGPAFWAFAAVVVVTALKDQLMCRYSIWEALDQA